MLYSLYALPAARRSFLVFYLLLLTLCNNNIDMRMLEMSTAHCDGGLVYDSRHTCFTSMQMDAMFNERFVNL